ncbi:MAG: glucose-1-phosphate thymidylyltransferase, partial [Flavobacteriia bacterium]|nr:glucose-1-phosphate thymidylyltransferase [Flavobacteriia bacterium]
MRIQLVDTSSRDHLLPLTFTRPVAALRCGILTVAEKYTRRGHEVGYGTQEYLSKKFPALQASEVCIDGGVCPTDAFLETVSALEEGQSLCKGDAVIAWKGAQPSDTSGSTCYNEPLTILARPW